MEVRIDMDWELITRLMKCFPNSFINHNGEFIAHAKRLSVNALRKMLKMGV